MKKTLLTPPTSLGLLQAPGQCGGGHEAVTSLARSRRLANYNFAQRHAAGCDLEDSSLWPCAGRGVKKICACGILRRALWLSRSVC